MAQKQVGLCLIAAPIALQPIDDVFVQPDGYRAFNRPVEEANFRIGPVQDLRHVGEINRSVGLGGDGGYVPLERGCELLHGTEFTGCTYKCKWEMLESLLPHVSEARPGAPGTRPTLECLGRWSGSLARRIERVGRMGGVIC